MNFGCGVAIANFNGKEKFRTTIGDGAFLGCNTNLVAPVTIGAGAYTAAGATVTRDVPEDAMLIARAEQTAASAGRKNKVPPPAGTPPRQIAVPRPNPRDPLGNSGISPNGGASLLENLVSTARRRGVTFL